jgi:hypothetical protein
MCTFPSNGAQMQYSDTNFNVLKIGCWPTYIIVYKTFAFSAVQLEAELWNNIENNSNGDISRLGQLLLGRL